MNQPTPRLQRSRTDKMLGGVSGGLGVYFNVDPVIVRLIFVTLTLTTGLGVPLYIIMWIIMPLESARSGTPAALPAPDPARTPVAQAEPFYAYTSATRRVDPLTGNPDDAEEIPVQNVNPDAASSSPPPASNDDATLRRNRILGLILIGVGAFFALKTLLPALMPFVLPALLIAAGIWILRK